MLLYYDEVQIQEFNHTEKYGVVQRLPANYPHYYRSRKKLWWTFLVISVAAFKNRPLDSWVDELLRDVEGHMTNQDTVYDTFTNTTFPLKMEVIGLQGDLPGQNQLLKFPKSFSR